MALPADGSPALEGLPDNGKEHSKLCLHEADTVSEDHGEELRYSLPSQSVDCSTSSSGSSTSSSGSSTSYSGSSTSCSGSSTSSSGSSTSSSGSSTSSSGSSTSCSGSSTSSSGSSATRSIEDELGNACTTSSNEGKVGNACTTSSNEGTTRSNKDEVHNEDQNDFKSRLRVVQVLRPNIKFLWGIGVLEQSLKHLNWTVDKLSSADTSLTGDRADAMSQLLKILPPHFKYIKVIGVSRKPQEDTASCTKLDKQEEPILRPKKSRPIGTLKHHQVDLEEDTGSLTSDRDRRTRKKMDAAKKVDPPSKLRFGTVLPSRFLFTSGLDKQEEPILRSEDSRPIGTLQHHQVGLKEHAGSLTSGRDRRARKKMDAAKEDDPPHKLSFGAVLPSSFKFTCELDKKQEPNMRPISISPQPLAGWKTLVASVAFDRTRRTTKKVNAAKEDEPSSKPSHQIGLKEDAAHETSVTAINRKRTKDSDAEEQPPAKRTRDTVDICRPSTASCEDPGQSSPLLVPLPTLERNLPVFSDPDPSPSCEMPAKEDPPAKRIKISLPPRGDLFAKFRPGAEDPAERPKDSITEEEVDTKRTNHSDEVFKIIVDRLAWRIENEWGDKANPSKSLFNPRCRKGCKAPTLRPPILFYRSSTESCEEPRLSSPLLVPVSTLRRNLHVFSDPDLSLSCEIPHEMPAKQEPSPKRTSDTVAKEDPPCQED
ncbi:uncharacterized protein LOC114157104 [Xiphophorus couchianus]|uniref:uncharacterized protein LOC114157104 n=1 Tax=Xiphophorus couchianus TaxID=32473 RepID=UPI00101618EC|nr:uncharacterized protein LOC114157104 [Xiphophorus couchianus]